MKREQLQFTGPGAVTLGESTVDDDLGATELLGETRYSLVSPGTEVMSARTADADAFPRETGYAAVDRVLAVGTDVEEFAPGDLVFVKEEHASHHVVDTAESPVVPVPESVSAEEAPFARLCGVSAPSIQTADVRPPALAGVFGLGLVGNLACQLLRVFGYDVVGIDPLAARRAFADAVGVETALDPAADGELSERLDEAAGESSCQLLFECSGTAAALADAVDVADVDAELRQIGFPWVETTTDAGLHEVQRAVFETYLTLRNGSEWQIPMMPAAHRPYSHRENYAHALDLLAAGNVSVEPLITHVVAPDEAQRAYDGLADEKEEYLGVLIDWS